MVFNQYRIKSVCPTISFQTDVIIHSLGNTSILVRFHFFMHSFIHAWSFVRSFVRFFLSVSCFFALCMCSAWYNLYQGELHILIRSNHGLTHWHVKGLISVGLHRIFIEDVCHDRRWINDVNLLRIIRWRCSTAKDSIFLFVFDWEKDKLNIIDIFPKDTTHRMWKEKWFIDSRSFVFVEDRTDHLKENSSGYKFIDQPDRNTSSQSL